MAVWLYYEGIWTPGSDAFSFTFSIGWLHTWSIYTLSEPVLAHCLRQVFQTLRDYNLACGLAVSIRFDDLDHISRLQVCRYHNLQIDFDFHEKCEYVNCNDQWHASRLAECPYINVVIFSGAINKYDKCQSVHEGNTHWALPIHTITTFSDLDYIWRSQQCQTASTENFMFLSNYVETLYNCWLCQVDHKCTVTFDFNTCKGDNW